MHCDVAVDDKQLCDCRVVEEAFTLHKHDVVVFMWQVVYFLLARYDLNHFTASATDLELGLETSICN